MIRTTLFISKEKVSCSMKRDVIVGIWLGHDKVVVSHLQFIEDTIVFLSHDSVKFSNVYNFAHI